MVAVENTPTVHNMVVCTLCSCYPWPVLGLPPAWYKSAAYRSRSVIEPRVVLREFGLNLPDEIEVRVWDSTAEVRYLVLPERPAGTDAMTEGTTHGAGPGAPRFDDRRRSGICGEVDDGSRYYDHWLVALERLITAKQVLSPSDLDRRKVAWTQAYLSTPHGQPVELQAGSETTSGL